MDTKQPTNISWYIGVGIIMNRYLFTCRMNGFDADTEEAVSVDAFYKVPLRTEQLDYEVCKAQEELLGNPWHDEIQALGSTMNAMRLRLRFNQDMFQGICMIKTDQELDIDDMECLLRAHSRRGTLNNFLKEAKVA